MLKFARFTLFLIALQVAVSPAVLATDKPLRVAFMVPSEDDIPRWRSIVEFMQAVAEDLNIDLQVVYSKPNEISMTRAVNKMLNAAPSPDYFISGRWSESSLNYLQTANQLNIKTLTIGAGYLESDRVSVGFPRGKLRNWIGELAPDDEVAAYELADDLIGRAKQLGNVNANGKVAVLAIGSYEGDAVNTLRMRGLQRRINQDKDAVLLDVVLGGWRRDPAREVTLKAYGQFEAVDVIWAASDEMALGAVDAVRQRGQKPGADVSIGGFDWEPEAIDAIINGELETSYGGQLFQAGWGLILLHDYEHGVDFADTLDKRLLMKTYPMTAKDAQDYKQSFETADWRACDFRQFSKVLNPALKEYDMHPHAMVEALMKKAK